MPLTALPCSSFSLERKDVLIVGRNLDSDSHCPGLLVVNKHGVQKTGRSFQWLVSGKSDSPPIAWVAKYGSLTFNFSGIEFPESGVNEAGLSIEEMTLLETEYPSESNKPKLFMEQWIQYVLDTCATVDEVVERAQTVAIDGWNWHFYVVDKTGNSAVIEFLNGDSSVRVGKTLPQPVLCNSIYDEEMGQLASYQGFGGKQVVELDNPKVPRFVQGAHLLKVFQLDEDPIAYGFMILDTMSRGTTKWSKIVDLHKKRVTFRTDVNPRLRYVDLDSLDFSCKTPRLILDVHAELSGDVRSSFKEYTDEANRALVEKAIASLTKLSEFEPIVKSMGGTRNGMTRRFYEYPGTTSCK
jgi:choloylglycine hydrolase